LDSPPFSDQILSSVTVTRETEAKFLQIDSAAASLTQSHHRQQELS
jgi:hypothetical protein